MITGSPSRRIKVLGTVVTIAVFATATTRISTAEEAVLKSQSYAKDLSAAFRHAAQAVLPSVVSIQKSPLSASSSKNDEQESERNPFHGTPFEDLFRDRELRRFFEPPRGQLGMGSGCIIDRSGVILTNHHVVAGPGSIRIRLSDGREFDAAKVKSDRRTDLAVVWIEGASDLKAAQLGDSEKLEIGDWVLAVGHPFGLYESVTAGIISAKGRGIGVAIREDFLQTDAAINPGNSGGPLINLDGKVIGINTAISSRTGAYQGAGFAIPVNLARWVVRQLIETGEVRRAYLGTKIDKVTQQVSEQFNVAVGSGVLIRQVFGDSPAHKAGIQPGDLVVTFAGKRVRETQELIAAVETAEIGSKQPIEIMRDGKRMTLEVTVQLQPENYGLTRLRRREESSNSGKEYENLGLAVEPLTRRAAADLGIEDEKGVLISAVRPNSPAREAGLNKGMVITEVNRQPVASIEEFDAAVKKKDPNRGGLLMKARTEIGSLFAIVKPEED